MKTIVLDGGLMPTREEAYAYLTQQLELPDFCGKNLDALYDALTAETADPSGCLPPGAAGAVELRRVPAGDDDGRRTGKSEPASGL